MRRRAYAAAGLAAALLLHAAGALADDAPKPSLEKRYTADGDSTGSLMVVPLTRGAWPVYRLVAVQWEGVGFFDGTTYWGVFRRARQAAPPELAGASGTHRATLRPDGSLAVHGEYTAGGTGSFETVWRPERRATPPLLEQPREAPPSPDGLPKVDEYPYVDELPEAVKKVAPVYPEIGPGIEGTVLIQALVGKDGRVKDTRVIKSIPILDEAAEASVRQWVFKPALSKGKPVAVWVAIPVRFSRH